MAIRFSFTLFLLLDFIFFGLSLDPTFITQISIERTSCSGDCSLYKLDLYRSSSKTNASYIGGSSVTKKGLWTGSVSLADFNRLCNLLVEKRFLSFNDSYQNSAADSTIVYTGMEWVEDDGQTLQKVVKNYGNTGPTDLIVIEQAIDNVAESGIQWNEVSGSNTSLIVGVTIVIIVIVIALVIGAVIIYKRRKAHFRYMQVAREEDEEMQNPFILNYK